jgi:hypothetical protein
MVGIFPFLWKFISTIHFASNITSPGDDPMQQPALEIKHFAVVDSLPIS